jgi:hypothetical protein
VDAAEEVESPVVMLIVRVVGGHISKYGGDGDE